jgi:two-component system heavy metal sensor histidine kinase CusS
MMNRLNIRWKLTLWYSGVLGLVLIAFGAAVFVMMRHHLLEGIDQGLEEELDDVLSEVTPSTSEKSLKDWLNRRFVDHEGFDFQITKPDGERFFYSSRLADKAWPKSAGESDVPLPQTISVEANGNWRIIASKVAGPSGPLTVQVGRSLAYFEHELAELLMTFLFAGPMTLLATISGGYFLACRVLQPVQAMTKAARQISADRLHERIAVVNPNDEFGELAATLNDMIERLEHSFVEMQRFTADAAHELRTPLAIIRSEMEVALRFPRSSEQYCGVLECLLEDTNRLSTLADQLLFLSRQEAGISPKVREAFALNELLQEVVGNMQLVAQVKDISLQLTENALCQLRSDQRLLRRVVINLLDNAIKYTGIAGQVIVTCRVSNGEVAIKVTDSGVGIAPEHLPHVFDRFYRVDAARSGEENGAGLGLSICQSIVRSLGGTIRVESKVGNGSTVTVTLLVGKANTDVIVMGSEGTPGH